MTIQQGMKEAFRRQGATEEQIEKVILAGHAAFPGQGEEFDNMPIEPGLEEKFIAAYMRLTDLISEGPARDCAEAYLNARHAHN